MPNTDRATKAPRHRSPPYPAFNLETALSKAHLLLNKEKGNSVVVGVAIADMGYGKNNGDGGRAIAALLSYALLEASGDGASRVVRPSELALRILKDKRSDSSQREALIQRAALNPPLHAKLWDRYKDALPSDDQLEYDLEVDMEFNPMVVKSVIREYRSTLEFSKLLDGVIDPSVIDQVSNETKPDLATRSKDNTMTNQNIDLPCRYALSVGEGRQFVLSVPKLVTQEDYDLFAQWIRFLEKRLVVKPQEDKPEAEHREVESQNAQA